MHRGFWKKHGLDVELVYLRGGSRTVSALIAGNVVGGLNATPAFIQWNRSQALRFLRGYMEGIQYMKFHQDESLKIFAKYARNPDLGNYGLSL